MAALRASPSQIRRGLLDLRPEDESAPGSTSQRDRARAARISGGTPAQVASIALPYCQRALREGVQALARPVKAIFFPGLRPRPQ